MAQPILLLADMLSGWGAATACAARQEAEAIHDRQRLVERIAVIEARLAQIDPDFHGEAVSALRVLRGAGGRPGGALGSPVAED